MPRFTHKLLCQSSRKRGASQEEASHHSKKQKKCLDDDDALASSTNKPYKRSQKISSKGSGFTPTAVGPHFQLRPHTGATEGGHDGMQKNSSNKALSADKQCEERSDIEANKQQYGGLSRTEYLKNRKCCVKCGPWWKRTKPVQMGCYSPGTEPDHIPYHLYKLLVNTSNKALSATNKQCEEERSHIEAKKQYGGMSRPYFAIKRNCCVSCGPGWKVRKPVQMGYYSPGTEPDHIPYHLYKLVKEVADIRRSPPEMGAWKDLPRLEETIDFFCFYFNCHLPRGWEYKRSNASSLIAGYDTFFAKDGGPRYDLSGYTPYRDMVKKRPNTAECMRIVHSRKTPTPETFMKWSRPRLVFYCKLCSCFGIDYQHLETASEEDVCLMNVGC